MARSGDSLVGARYYLVKGAGSMPIVEKSGVYRNADGHAYFLRKGRVASDELLAEYALDDEAELDENAAAIVAAESDGEVASLGPEIESAETDNVSFPNVIEPEVDAVPDEPVPVAPSQRKRKPAENRVEKNIETPESGAAAENRSLDDSDGDGKSDADEAEDADV